MCNEQEPSETGSIRADTKEDDIQEQGSSGAERTENAGSERRIDILKLYKE